MSRAFVSEAAAEANAAVLPERAVSPGPNPVTARGLALIEAELARLQDIFARTGVDDPERAVAARDLRYWRARRANAAVVPPHAGPIAEVAFGCRVTVRRGGGNAATYRIVGEDEADPAQGLLSWSSPMAQALIGAQAGDEVDIGGGRAPVTVQAISED